MSKNSMLARQKILTNQTSASVTFFPPRAIIYVNTKSQLSLSQVMIIDWLFFISHCLSSPNIEDEYGTRA